MKKLPLSACLLLASFCAHAVIDIADLGASEANADNTAIIQNAVNQASVSGEPVRIPRGVFKHTGLVGKSNVKIYGEGPASVLFNTSATVALDLTGTTGAEVFDLALKGTATVLSSGNYPTMSQTGVAVKVSNASKFILSNLKISYVGTGVDYSQSANWGAKGHFSNIDIEYAYKAVYTYSGGEYGHFDGVHVDSSTFGFHVDSGNNVFIGAQVVRSGVAVKISGGANNGHGSFIGGTFNHNNYNLDVWDSVSLGESFVGCNFIGDGSGGNSGQIRIMNSRGITITGGQIGSNITIDGGSGTQNGPNLIAGNYIRTDLPGYAPPAVTNGGVGLFKNNYSPSGMWVANN